VLRCVAGFFRFEGKFVLDFSHQGVMIESAVVDVFEGIKEPFMHDGFEVSEGSEGGEGGAHEVEPPDQSRP